MDHSPNLAPISYRLLNEGEGVEQVNALLRESYQALADLGLRYQATHLIRLYEKRGYRLVGNHHWGVTNYMSVVMSKKL